MLPPQIRLTIKAVADHSESIISRKITEAVEKTESRADDRANRSEAVQEKIAANIEILTKEINAYTAARYTYEGKKGRQELLTLAALVAGAIFSLVLAVVAYLQWCTLEKTDTTLRDTLAANQASQMPYVTVRSLKVEEGDKLRYRDPLQKYWSFRFEFENSGSTITRNLQIFPAFVFQKAPGDVSLDQLQVLMGNASTVPHAPIDPAVIKETTQYKERNLVLGPHSIQVVGGIAVSADFLRQPNNRWFAYGIATYNDIFSQRPHVTKFCYEVIGLVGANETPGIAACSHWNCADEECKADEASYKRQATK